MLTPEQIAALRDKVGHLTDPINDFLLEDIARRISEAGQLTSTAAYQVWRSQQLGVGQREVKRKLKKLLHNSRKEVNKLLKQAAEVGYKFDLDRFPTSAAIPFDKNGTLQQILAAAVELAEEDFANITQTLGMVDPYGNALPLQDVYRSCTDFAFKQVIAGAADYTTAIRRATSKLAEKGVLTIDYESGVHTSLEAAVRRNIMGGLGLMVEQITQYDHDLLGADGWEISAHANSAPDHEPYQGRQYSDEAYANLNNSLRRRIGTLNCGHNAMPIILGVNAPQYTPEELEKFREDNAKGITYEGKHYTGYEATQMQRRIERSMRKQKRNILLAEGTGDKENLLNSQIKLQRIRQEYKRFSSAAGLRTENDRLFVAKKIKLAAADAQRNTGRIVKYNPEADFSIKLSGYRKKVQSGLSKASKIVAREGGADGLEHLQLVDLESGQLIYHENGQHTAVGGPDFWKYIKENPGKKIAFVHNHITDGYFSEDDMRTFLHTDSIKMFVAVRLDGVKYIAEKTGSPPTASYLFDSLYQEEIDALTQKLRDGIITSGERTRKREQLLVDNLLRDYTKGLVELDGRN